MGCYGTPVETPMTSLAEDGPALIKSKFIGRVYRLADVIAGAAKGIWF
jgi:hypothetical protein